ncbi:conjugative transposon protein TraK [Mucilaginibacter dorajii]|uniref:Conjugative transposon protein TraK n=1 Tax=Mucilaginibacter dorajii TaxID=692994 RepID=A0ABP7Q4S1_9SPHI|nr:conjugative transposon protein TraK [Mucilaginibacter dorajii]MCS3732572.1 conjugative transposon TraK protein [Mucilaginibacter dorajii]
MFKQLKNIDTAFQHIKRFSLVLIAANVVICCLWSFVTYKAVTEAQQRVHILYNGKVFEAFASTRKANLPVELRDHIKDFHHYFFDQSPDDKEIKKKISKALYLADNSAKKQYDNLVESGYYNNLISANISQEVEIDSIKLDINTAPYQFTCYATEKLIRASNTVVRKLVTQGVIRDLGDKTDDNPHGFLIQQWQILENSDATNAQQP